MSGRLQCVARGAAPDAQRGRIPQSAGEVRPFVRGRASVARASNVDGVSHSISAASTPSNAA